MEIKNILRKDKKGAMEMSVGTIVTIVLLMSVLVLGIFLVQKIFRTGTNAIDNVDQQVQGQINELFTDSQGKEFVVVPQTQPVTIAKGETGSFAFAVRNTGRTDKTYSYSISAQPGRDCQMSAEQAMGLIQLGSEGEDINVNSGDIMTMQEVRMSVPDETPLCLIRYKIDIDNFGTRNVDVEIVSGGFF